MRHGGRRLYSARIASGLEADLPAHDRMMWDDEPMVTFAGIALRLIEDAVRWLVPLFRSTEAVRAENLFLRRQLALFIDRGVRPRRVDAATRVSLVLLAKLFEWRGALMVVQPMGIIVLGAWRD